MTKYISLSQLNPCSPAETKNKDNIKSIEPAKHWTRPTDPRTGRPVPGNYTNFRLKYLLLVFSSRILTTEHSQENKTPHILESRLEGKTKQTKNRNLRQL